MWKNLYVCNSFKNDEFRVEGKEFQLLRERIRWQGSGSKKQNCSGSCLSTNWNIIIKMLQAKCPASLVTSILTFPVYRKSQGPDSNPWLLYSFSTVQLQCFSEATSKQITNPQNEPCVTPSKSFNPTEPYFFHQQNNTTPYPPPKCCQDRKSWFSKSSGSSWDETCSINLKCNHLIIYRFLFLFLFALVLILRSWVVILENFFSSVISYLHQKELHKGKALQ